MRALLFDPDNAIVIFCWRVFLFACCIFLWWMFTSLRWISPFFFGEPVGVAKTLVTWFTSGSVFIHLWITLVETIISFVIGTALGLAVGLWLALNRFAAEITDPFVKAFNAMPRLIFAPIFALWFGLGIWSKIALGVSLVFYIVFFNVFQGIREVNPVILANTRMLGASSKDLMRHVYLPSAMSWVFSSLHNAVGIAFVGSVVGEYLGSVRGVGYLILLAEGVFDINAVIAGILLLTVFALGLDAAVSLFESRFMSWRPSSGQTADATA